MKQTKQDYLADLNQEFATALGESLRSAGSSLNGGATWDNYVSDNPVGASSTRRKGARTVALPLGGAGAGEVVRLTRTQLKPCCQHRFRGIPVTRRRRGLSW